jgi:hypothetical protein
MWQALLVVMMLVIGGQVAEGCSCTGPHGRSVLIYSGAVFTAKVSKVDYLEPDAKGIEPRILVTFEVDRVWKGPERPIALLRTVENKWTCDGYFFKAGSEYLVAAQRVVSEGSTSTPAELEGVSICGGTASLATAHSDVAELGRGKRPKKANR